MSVQQAKVIELGTASAMTRGGTLGIVDSETSMMLRLGLTDD